MIYFKIKMKWLNIFKKKKIINNESKLKNIFIPDTSLYNIEIKTIKTIIIRKINI